MIPWLGSKPDVKKMGDIRRTIKSLRSKLRHRLADKKDLEEVSRKFSQGQLCQYSNAQVNIAGIQAC